MSSRFSAARPKRASEAFARTHHGEGSQSNKKVRFDVRNPSALAPTADSDAEDDQDDEVLAADVIGASTRATKRGAVNIDGYDSDSENEHFEARAEARGDNTSKVNLEDALDNYNSKSGPKKQDSDDEIDMFGDLGDSDNDTKSKSKSSRKDKTVNFLDTSQIEGQEGESKSGGRVHLDQQANTGSDDEEEETEEQIAAAIAEEGLDEEVGLGGLKKHAPKIDAFNMRAEQEDGAFDEAGNFIRKAVDADAVHDRWLEGVSKKEMKAAAAAHEKREAELRQKQKESDSISTGDLMTKLILRLEKGENALDALARLRKGQKKEKKIPKWKQNKKKKNNAGDEMDVDEEKKEKDPEQEKIKGTIGEIADAADKLMGREYPDIYDYERERLCRMYYNETGERWVEPEPPAQAEEETGPKMWEFRWTDGRDGGEGNVQGPFDGATMEAWKGAGYFGEGVEFRVKGGDEWTRVADFV
ncbi:hypothetical protein QBC40DRAFT_311893 [Triangularia verruculosa]|uniref:GYF domain-containing protein n=1 Tax=Triangularia verruculosa TaxID=2587418 RepID=A0AAN6XU89_9PEZI|nr:hypothetical protein QBC40DRAFT_311893 [Triangularia verruculosa]